MQVDGTENGNETLDVAPFWSISRLAERDGISKQAVSKRVARLVEGGELPVERDGQGRVVAVDVAMFDALVERYGHASRSQAPGRTSELPLAGATGEGGGTRPRTLDEAQRQKTFLDAAKRRLEVGELTGRLLRADRFTDAVAKCGEEIVRIAEGLPQQADALARALDLDDVHGCRLALKGMAHKLRTDLADVLARLAAEAPATDEPLAEDDDEVM